MKIKTVYQCTECQAETSKWQGQCLSCKAWNCLVEKTVTTKSKKSLQLSCSVRKLSSVENVKLLKIPSFTNELQFFRLFYYFSAYFNFN